MIDISENHRRKIGITLGMLDAMLCDFEAWADAGEIRSALYRRTNRLTSKQVRQIREEAAEMRRLIARMRDDLKLEAQQDEVATMIWSQASCFWESLVELEGGYLRGYGNPTAELEAYMTAKAQELNERLQQITRIVSTRAAKAQT